MRPIGGSGWVAVSAPTPDGPNLRRMSGAVLMKGMRRRLAAQVEWAKECLSLWLERCERPYVAYSGGKDSGVLLHLARTLRPDIEAVLFIDRDGAMPGVLEMVEWWRREGVTVHVHVHGSLADSIAQYGRPIMDLGACFRWAREQGFDGVARGLRADESKGRQAHATYRHPVRQRVEGWWEADPIIWWSGDDVWAYHALHGLPYVAHYDIEDGQPRNRRRVGEPLGLIGATYGRVARLKRHHHALYQRLAALVPELGRYT